LLHGPSLRSWRFGHLAGCPELNVEAENRVRRFEGEAVIHQDSLFGSALEMTRSRVETEDFVPEAGLRGFEFHGRSEPGTNCRAWLFRIMTNLFINSCNNRKSRDEFYSYDEISGSPLSASHVSSLSGPQEAAGRAVEGGGFRWPCSGGLYK
jgi:RNA polymerase sigma-70 factor (ECF subfamily)